MNCIVFASFGGITLLQHVLMMVQKGGEPGLDLQMQIAIISAGAALLGSLIGALATILSSWVTRKTQYIGKVTLYVKIVYEKTNEERNASRTKTWRFQQDGNCKMMVVPIWLEVCNTCGAPRIIRDVNLYAFKGNNEVATFTQIQRKGEGEKAIKFGNNESYTLVITENNAQRYEMMFALREDEIDSRDKVFDALVLQYFDENNGKHSYLLSTIPECWHIGELKRPREWVSLTGNYPNHYRL